jgi:hypothetical protein
VRGVDSDNRRVSGLVGLTGAFSCLRPVGCSSGGVVGVVAVTLAYVEVLVKARELENIRRGGV